MPEFGIAQTGKTEKVSYKIENGRTIIPLKFETWDAYFIIFKEKSNVKNYTKRRFRTATSFKISSPWKVKFQEGRGAPPSDDI